MTLKIHCIQYTSIVHGLSRCDNVVSLFKDGVIPEILEMIEHCNFQTITVICIKVYILWLIIETKLIQASLSNQFYLLHFFWFFFTIKLTFLLFFINIAFSTPFFLGGGSFPISFSFILPFFLQFTVFKYVM